MAEIYLRLYRKFPVDDLLNDTFIGRGDAVEVMPDGFNWKKFERESPDHLIVRVDAPMAKVQTLMSPQQGDREINPLLYDREFAIDIDLLIAKGYPIPQDRTTVLEFITISEADFDAAKYRKPAIADPAMVGGAE